MGNLSSRLGQLVNARSGRQRFDAIVDGNALNVDNTHEEIRILQTAIKSEKFPSSRGPWSHVIQICRKSPTVRTTSEKCLVAPTAGYRPSFQPLLWHACDSWLTHKQ